MLPFQPSRGEWHTLFHQQWLAGKRNILLFVGLSVMLGYSVHRTRVCSLCQTLAMADRLEGKCSEVASARFSGRGTGVLSSVPIPDRTFICFFCFFSWATVLSILGDTKGGLGKRSFFPTYHCVALVLFGSLSQLGIQNGTTAAGRGYAEIGNNQKAQKKVQNMEFAGGGGHSQ